MTRICVLGLGYIGLPTASVFAANGFHVVGVDVDSQIVDVLSKGQIHINEPGLKTVVCAAIQSGNMLVRQVPEQADVFIIAVPTPLKEDNSAELMYVIQATESILPFLQKGNLVILESTVPPRTTEDILVPILQKSGYNIGEEIYLVHCPERVLPGNILHEFVSNDRIIGGINDKSSYKARGIYEKVVQGNLLITDATSAEMAKLMENTYRDVNIALANEVCRIAYDLNLDALEIIKLANMHPRVNLHQPGPGVGGHCLAVDPWFIVEKSNNAELIRLSREINDAMPDLVVGLVKKMLDQIVKPKITVLGVTYKGNVDDIRESPATEVIRELKQANIDVGIYDPYVKNYEFELSNLEEAFVASDLILLLADHKEFKYLSADELGLLMRNKQLFDTRNCLNHNKWKDAGFSVKVLGKNNQNS
ncbi:nucleotide sugar dehydrogenase [Sporomusa sp. KB1]|jgi:UDP-N-acetyl-D-mannosaminuronic acid dehydrogenase|uniref:nucleotide sugar dehydrogenase n=1 Tax=Sporomusa sp. KB1 TaxID=943346 RepID=UPI0011A3F705|nr:nucleotide sugar dehydrogenase [Sporomusa sp. KB1]TWH47692.1 UDP-N-acetyl-D-mannosaminuronic acid dehydrogenase [Sporomusa sp. KB1]